jgi:hypothetical protein
MKTVFPFFIIALVSAAPTTSEDERIAKMKYAETGKGWKVEASASGASSRVLIHLLQSKTVSHKGVGAAFLIEGRFPTPRGDNDGSSIFKGHPIIKKSNLEYQLFLGKPAFCPKSDRMCKDGATWTARQTEMKDANLLETRVVFSKDEECESFILEWKGVCDSWTHMRHIYTYLQETNFRNSSIELNNEIIFHTHGRSYVQEGATPTNAEKLEALVRMINLLQGLKDTAPLDHIETVFRNAIELFDKLEGLKVRERWLRSGKLNIYSLQDLFCQPRNEVNYAKGINDRIDRNFAINF